MDRERSWPDLVREFHEKFKVKTPITTKEELELQLGLITEEISELKAATYEELYVVRKVKDIDSIKALDAICDAVYVLIGLAEKLGMDIDGAFREVHRSNMTKLGAKGQPLYRKDGKIMKGANYTAPNLYPYV